MQVHPIIKYTVLAGWAVFFCSGCYYDNSQELYPGNNSCDTTQVTFSAFVMPAINTQCKSCHSGTNPSGGIALTDYATVKASISSGKLYGSLAWQTGYSGMPQGGSKWSNCNLLKLKSWIDKGAPNN